MANSKKDPALKPVRALKKPVRKKKTKRQKQAARKRSYYKREYEKTAAAIAAMEDYGIKAPKITIPKKITKASLGKIRKQYKKQKTKAKQKGIALPTKKELAQEMMQDKNQEYRWRRSEGFDPGRQYLDALIEDLEAQMPLPRSKMSTEWYFKLYDEEYMPAIQRIKDQIEAGAGQIGTFEMSQQLASNEYVQKVAEIPMYYIDEAAGFVDTEVSGAVQAAISGALIPFDME